MIMQPDGTMKLDSRESVSSTRKSSNVIVAKNVPVSSQSPLVPANSITQNGYRLFDGIPVFMNGEAILFDSSRPEQTSKVPKTVVLKKLEFVIKDKITEPHTRLYLLLYLGDTAVPRLKVLIKDMLQHNGSRPLNLQRTDGELLKIVLVDPDGEWTNQVSHVEMVIQ